MKIYSGAVTNNQRWPAYEPRTGDAIIATPPKSGTTWMQSIVGLLAGGGKPLADNIPQSIPWFDVRMRDLDDVTALLAGQDHQRAIKTHTPFDGMPYFDQVHYLTVYRHPLDVHFSMRRHTANMPLDVLDWYYPDDFRLGFRRFLEGVAEGADYDAPSLSGILHHHRTFRDAADRGNIHFFHYADMKRDLPGTVRRVASILGMSLSEDVLDAVTEAATFGNMKADAARFAPSGGDDFWKSDSAFFDSASDRKWEMHLTADDLDDYDAMVRQVLSETEKGWLENGSTADAAT